jgi:hypothetical protein
MPTQQGGYQVLLAAWLGQLPLWQTFWPFFLLMNGALYYSDYRIATVSYTIASWKTVLMMLLLPIIGWLVAVWRSSMYTRYKISSAVARTVTLYVLLELSLRVLISSQFPETLFDCRLLIIEYGDCW